MSRWSNSPVSIGVGTREIVVGVRAPGLWRPRKQVPPPEPASFTIPDDEYGTEAGLLDALRTALVTTPGADADDADEQAPREAKPSTRNAHVVLDDFWGIHAILRGDFRTLRARELEEVALAHFTDTYGIDGATLLVRFCVQQGGRALFASAMSRALHDGIHEVGAAGQVRIGRLKLCLPEMLNSIDMAAGGDALLMFVAEELMQAVMIEQRGWAAYDAQRLFPGDAGNAPRLAELAEQLFERSATRAGLKREDCTIYLFGNDTDPAPFEARFAAAIRPAQPTTENSPARRLMEYAQ
ncbi:hypothetical protein M3I53_08680 [Paraburkholderia sp. CNPSo 3272]|uniref:hypothetical protein n=1 Tax=Paraburkholderia sp. CNPSo 3272 TaxID=2940931 RepID=UPI0020B88725|nr:hypothetical protein [Paraburkholderia sp. CNPSo 3272]MCP3723206.1 hypothetical protein [Paraburkholderia sp. CNPSo 3272]